MPARPWLRAAVLLALAAPVFALSAQGPNPGTPSGTQGHDWDVQSFRLDGDHLAVVTAVNVSNQGNGTSSAGFDVWLDGVRIDTYTTGGVIAAKAYFVRGAGRHNVLIRCTNNIAAMVSCRTSVMRADEGVVL